MADHQRWFWLVVRLANRNRWTVFGGFAALTILALAGITGFLYVSGIVGQSNGPADFWIPFGIMAVLLTFFWLGMALANLVLERRGRAFSPETAESGIEALLGRRPWPKTLAPPSIRFIVILALIFGTLTYFGENLWRAVVVGVTWLLAGLILRWAWPTPRAPLRRLAVAAVTIALAVFVLDVVGRALWSRSSPILGIVDGAILGAVMFGLALWVRRLSSPDRHPVLLAGLTVRDRALALAGERHSGPAAVNEVLDAAKGMRAALEVAWDVLKKRPQDDAVAARALALVEQAIGAGHWGWWSWGRASGWTRGRDEQLG